MSWDRLLLRLRTHDCPIKKRIADFMGEDAQRVIRSWTPKIIMGREDKKILIDGLNRLLQDRGFYKKEIVSDFQWDEEGEWLVRKHKKGVTDKENTRLNRILLEGIFPDDLARGQRIYSHNMVIP